MPEEEEGTPVWRNPGRMGEMFSPIVTPGPGTTDPDDLVVDLDGDDSRKVDNPRNALPPLDSFHPTDPDFVHHSPPMASPRQLHSAREHSIPPSPQDELPSARSAPTPQTTPRGRFDRAPLTRSLTISYPPSSDSRAAAPAPATTSLTSSAPPPSPERAQPRKRHSVTSGVTTHQFSSPDSPNNMIPPRGGSPPVPDHILLLAQRHIDRSFCRMLYQTSFRDSQVLEDAVAEVQRERRDLQQKVAVAQRKLQWERLETQQTLAK